jgi:cytochrome c553
MKSMRLGVLLGISIVSQVALAAGPSGDPEAGKTKSAPCAACHAADGNSKSGEFPRLAGQHADYIYNALTHYQAKKRANPIMGSQVANLTAQDMADLAAYFSSQHGLEIKY